MIQDKTLLILGAGASVPYNYPTGIQLKDKICNSRNLSYLTKLNKTNDRGLKLFCKHFKESQMYSIDAFLTKRGKELIGEQPSGFGNYFGTYEEYGKLAIALLLINCEVPSYLFEPINDNDDNDNDDNVDHWLQYLWNHMSNDVEKSELQNNQLKIISFNYDRVLEQYFQTTIERTYGVSLLEAIELRKSFQIIHVYGNLQDLENRAYGEKPKDLR